MSCLQSETTPAEDFEWPPTRWPSSRTIWTGTTEDLAVHCRFAAVCGLFLFALRLQQEIRSHGRATAPEFAQSGCGPDGDAKTSRFTASFASHPLVHRNRNGQLVRPALSQPAQLERRGVQHERAHCCAP